LIRRIVAGRVGTSATDGGANPVGGRGTVARYLVPGRGNGAFMGVAGRGADPLAVVGGVLAVVGVILVRRVPSTVGSPSPARVPASAP
jgi:hypothetical protein